MGTVVASKCSSWQLQVIAVASTLTHLPEAKRARAARKILFTQKNKDRREAHIPGSPAALSARTTRRAFRGTFGLEPDADKYNTAITGTHGKPRAARSRQAAKQAVQAAAAAIVAAL